MKLATQSDISALLDLVQTFYYQAGYPFNRARSQQALSLLVASPHLGQAWLIERDLALVGYAVLTFGFSLEYGGRDAILDELYIRPEHQRQGLGTAAIARLEKVCLEEGIQALHLEVERGSRAVQLYKRVGFKAHERDFMTKWLV
ncbi:MAG: GNAT family N-acetyltransferase [Elainellaceae cyanobacterium]